MRMKFDDHHVLSLSNIPNIPFQTLGLQIAQTQPVYRCDRTVKVSKLRKQALSAKPV